MPKRQPKDNQKTTKRQPKDNQKSTKRQPKDNQKSTKNQRRPPAPLTSIKNDQKCAHFSQKSTLPGNDCGLRGPKLHTYFPKINPVPVRRAPPKANRDCTKASRDPASDSHSDFRAFRQVAPPSITTPLGNILIKAPLSTRSWLRGFSDCFISAPSRMLLN